MVCVDFRRSLSCARSGRGNGIPLSSSGQALGSKRGKIRPSVPFGAGCADSGFGSWCVWNRLQIGSTGCVALTPCQVTLDNDWVGCGSLATWTYNSFSISPPRLFSSVSGEKVFLPDPLLPIANGPVGEVLSRPVWLLRPASGCREILYARL
jgi:hypothetical protein